MSVFCEFLWRLCESPKEWRYGGWRAVLPWILHGQSSDDSTWEV